jgi:nucleoside-diphosphate-sugar epimerase
MASSQPQENKVVVVTGANGYIAGQVILSLLTLGYAVRGTVRSLERCQYLQSPDSAFFPYASKGLFSLVEVPDITSQSQLAAALKDAVAVAHLAAPVLFHADPDYIIGAAVNGTLAVLEAATQVKTLKSFVLMSSIAAVRVEIFNPSPPGHVITAEEWDDSDLKVKEMQSKGIPVVGPLAYIASKVAAERALWDFVKLRKPDFTVAAINPVLCAGPPAVPPPSADQLSITARFIFDLLAGKDAPPPETHLGRGAYVDVRDVARLVTFAIQHPDVTNGSRLIAASCMSHPQGVMDVLREAFPERRDIIQKGTPGEGYTSGFGFSEEGPNFDMEAVRVSGKGWISFEDTIRDAAEAYKVFL